jgi:signal peptidase I
MGKLLKNKWFKFALWSILWVLIFVVWMCNAWMLLGVAVIFDIFITRYFSRYVLKYHRTAAEKSATYKVVAEWVEAAVFAVVVASVFHTLAFQLFTIPSPSMEKSLLVGDYLYVSKLTYGPKMPVTPISMPLVHNTMPFSKTGAKSYSEAIQRPYKRLAGLRSIERGDVVVFNFPAGDTVLLENLNVTYYDEARNYGRAALEKRYTIVSRPVDKRENFVKRCVGLPGDTIVMRGAQLYVNGLEQKQIPGMQLMYSILTTSPFTFAALDGMGISRAEVSYNPSTGEYVLPLTAANLEKVSAMSNVIDIQQIEFGAETFPHDGVTPWTENDFGPLWIPARGATVALTTANLPLYERIIDVYEGHDLRVEGETIYIDGAVATSYTFGMNYFWMMGDNRQNSADSRFWGFVPEDHIVGKASFVWLSLDKEKGLFNGKIRWNRMFRKIS